MSLLRRRRWPVELSRNKANTGELNSNHIIPADVTFESSLHARRTN